MFVDRHAGGMARLRTCGASCWGHDAEANICVVAARTSGGHGGAMKSRSTAAGGIFIFAGLIAGAIYGINVGQPMLWLLRGFGAGVLLALLVWAVDRQRS
jgi:hypothetical protein